MNTLTKIGVAGLLATATLYFWDSIPGYAFVAVAVAATSYGLFLFSKTESGKITSKNLKKLGVKMLKSKSKSLLKREIGENYDAAVKRGRKSRVAFFVFSVAAFLLLPGYLVLKLISILGEVPDLIVTPTMLLGALVGGTVFSKFLPNYIVDTPQIQGFVTVNRLKAFFGIPGVTDVVYGPGSHISFPWEGRSEKSNFSLEVITYEFEETVPGKNVRLVAKGAIQFEAAVSRGERFIGIDENTFKEGVLKVIIADISQDLQDKTADEAKSMVTEENEKLMKTFATKTKSSKEYENKVSGGSEGSAEEIDRPTEFEEKYAIRIVAITINSIDLPEKAQETRDAVDEAEQAFIGVAKMFGMEPEKLQDELNKENGEINREKYLEMLDRFLAKSGNAKMDINAIKLSGGDMISAMAANIFGKGENK